ENWDNAVRTSYRYQNVEDLEKAWLAHLRATRRPPAELARNNQPQPAPRSHPGASLWAQNSTAVADPAQRVMVRQTVPPVQPHLSGPAPIYRGQSPEPENIRGTLTVRPGYLPDVPGMTPKAAPSIATAAPAPAPPVAASPRD